MATASRPRRTREFKQREASPLAESSNGFTPVFMDHRELAHEPLMVLAYGEPGTGKTRFTATFPKPIVFDFDRGASVIAQLPREQADDINVVRIDDEWARHPETGALYLPNGASRWQQLWQWYKWLKAGDHDRETIVIDTVTDLQKIVMDEVMRQNPGRMREAATVPCGEDYQESAERLDMLFRYFRDLPYHKVWTAHAKDKKDKQGATVATVPDMSPKPAGSLSGKCHIVMYTACMVDDQDNPSPFATQGDDGQWVRFVGQTRSSQTRNAKDRSGKMRTPFDDLHYDAIAAAWGFDDAWHGEQDTAETVDTGTGTATAGVGMSPAMPADQGRSADEAPPGVGDDDTPAPGDAPPNPAAAAMEKIQAAKARKSEAPATCDTCGEPGTNCICQQIAGI
jgi:hypothetical protein